MTPGAANKQTSVTLRPVTPGAANKNQLEGPPCDTERREKAIKRRDRPVTPGAANKNQQEESPRDTGRRAQEPTGGIAP